MPDQTKETTPVSTRFEPAELEVLKQAAALKQWSLSQLVRMGAYEKAVNIINSSGERLFLLRALVDPVLEHLCRTFIRQEAMDSHEIDGRNHQAFGRFLDGLRKAGAELAPFLEAEAWRILGWGDQQATLMDPNPETRELFSAIGSSAPKHTGSIAAPSRPTKQRGKRKSGPRKEK